LLKTISSKSYNKTGFKDFSLCTDSLFANSAFHPSRVGRVKWGNSGRQLIPAPIENDSRHLARLSGMVDL